MIDVMNVNCPHCNTGFAIDVYTGEESRDFNATLTRKSTLHINWKELYEEISNGYVNEVLSEGDSISFQLKDGKHVSVTVAAKNLYQRNSVIFVFDDLLWKHPMNDRDTNVGGWAKSNMADYLEGKILPLLPDELAEIISPRTITQRLGGVEYKRTSKLWLPSLTEVRGETLSTKECDFGDKQFPIFRTEKSRVKALENGYTMWYWLRSPYVAYSTSFWLVSSGGTNNNGSVNYSCGVFPCFSICSKTHDDIFSD